MRRSLLIATTLLVTAMALPVAAQPYPTRPIQFVIPFATGGPTDTAIRVIQPQLADIDFGDGTPKSRYLQHSYRRPGDYTVTVNVKDDGGRPATVSKRVHVAYRQLGFAPITPLPPRPWVL